MSGFLVYINKKCLYCTDKICTGRIRFGRLDQNKYYCEKCFKPYSKEEVRLMLIKAEGPKTLTDLDLIKNRKF